jgi:phage tail-like protein
MAEFTVNAQRFDPYKNMKFRIKWDGKYVAGVSKISVLKKTTEPVTHREGGDPSTNRVSPGIWKFDPITLERGLTHDPEFENWANLIYNTDGDAAISLNNFRKDLTIELLNEQGVVAKAYKVYRCWVSEYQAMPELDASAHVIAIERMVLQNEGWERDTAVPEPTQT